MQWERRHRTRRGAPVWSHDGNDLHGRNLKTGGEVDVREGRILDDPAGSFNSKLEGSFRLAIDFHLGDKVNEKRLKALIRAAVALNTSRD